MGIMVDSVVRGGVRLVKMEEQFGDWLGRAVLESGGVGGDVVSGYSRGGLRDVCMDRELNRLRYFCPTGAQEEYIRMLAGSVGSGSNQPIYTLFAGNGIGKCLPLSSPILMADGSYKCLGDVVVGDMVLCHEYDGSGIAVPVRVKQVSRAGVKAVYKVSFKDGGYVIASKEHSFPVKLRSGRSSRVTKCKLGDLMRRKVCYVGGKVKFQQPKSVEFIPQGELPIDPYLMGVLLGDGKLANGCIEITSISSEIIGRVSSILERDGYGLIRRPDSIQYGIIDRNKKYLPDKNGKPHKQNRIVAAIRELGLKVNSCDKFIPSIYKTASIHDRKELLAGLIDTDGTFNEYCTNSDRLASDFIWLVRSLGGTANDRIRTVNNEYTRWTDKQYHRIYWRFDYKLPLSLDRKQMVGKGQVEYSNRIVKSIESVGYEECGDICVDHPSHTYLSYDFISTGNTELIVNILGNIVFGCQNGWFDYPLFWDYPYKHNHWHVSVKNAILDAFRVSVESNFPMGRYEFSTRRDNFRELPTIVYDNDWRTLCKSFDQDLSQFESSETGLQTIDEPAPEAIWDALKQRTRGGGIALLNMTPLECDPYITDEIDKNSGNGIYYTMSCDVYSCTRERGIRGFRDLRDVEDTIRKMKVDERESRVYGKFMYFSERIYRLDPDVHLVEPVDYQLDWERGRCYQVVDPHDGRESAAGWGMIQPISHSDGYRDLMACGKAKQQYRYIVFGESPEYGGVPFWELRRSCTLSEEVERWCDHEDWLWSVYKVFDDSRERLPVYGRVIDKHFGFQMRGGKTLSNIYADEGRKRGRPFMFMPSYTNKSSDGEIAYGHNRVRELLLPLEDGRPGLVVYNSCVHVWNGLTHYVRKRMRGIDGDKAIGDTRIIERFKDFPDFVRYFACIVPSTYLDDVQTDRSGNSSDYLPYKTHDKDVMSVLSGMF